VTVAFKGFNEISDHANVELVSSVSEMRLPPSSEVNGMNFSEI
jgi:hypothetical protein